MLKPAANQAFGTKSSFWQQMKELKNSKKYFWHYLFFFGRRPLFLATKKLQKQVGGKSLFAVNAGFSISGSKSLTHLLPTMRNITLYYVNHATMRTTPNITIDYYVKCCTHDYHTMSHRTSPNQCGSIGTNASRQSSIATPTSPFENSDSSKDTHERSGRPSIAENEKEEIWVKDTQRL